MPTSFFALRILTFRQSHFAGRLFGALRVDDRTGLGTHHRGRQAHHAPMRADQDGSKTGEALAGPVLSRMSFYEGVETDDDLAR
jgi:hypothetical protein